MYTLVAVGLQMLTEQLEGIYIMYTLCKYTFFTNTTIPSTEPVIICMTLYSILGQPINRYNPGRCNYDVYDLILGSHANYL